MPIPRAHTSSILSNSTIASRPPSIKYQTKLIAWRYSNSYKLRKLTHKLLQYYSAISNYSTMSSCANCDCADKTQCVKKGNNYGIDIVETSKSYVETVVMDVAAAENDGKCKCGANCSCTTCTCGH